MFQKIGGWFRRFLYGRYGQDQLGAALLGLELLLLIAGIWVKWLLFPAVAVMAFQLYRCYSRDLTRRQKENAWFLRVTLPLRDRKNRYFRCPKCRQSVRVPRGKGRIRICCPKCGERFEKKT